LRGDTIVDISVCSNSGYHFLLCMVPRTNDVTPWNNTIMLLITLHEGSRLSITSDINYDMLWL